MKTFKQAVLAAAAAAAVSAAIGPAQALAVQAYDPDLIAYSYVYYADEARTEVLGYASDRCGQSGSYVYVIRPYIPTPYYDQTQIFVCSGGGPYLPPDF